MIFTDGRITSKRSRFAKVVQALPPNVVDDVVDILENDTEIEPYTYLKCAIIKTRGLDAPTKSCSVNFLPTSVGMIGPRLICYAL